MRHFKKIEAIISAGIWFHQHVPIPVVRVIPLKLMTFFLVIYWRTFGIE